MGNPFIQGKAVSILWQGPRPPRMQDDLTNWDEDRPFKRLAPNLWAAVLSLPQDAYLEYAFFDLFSGERIPDPLNPRRVSNGMGAWNQYFFMPKAGPSALIQPVPGVPHGVLTRHTVSTGDLLIGRQRKVILYRPPVSVPVPLMIVYDGPQYLQQVRLNIMVDNLIAQGRIRPFAMALVQNGGQARLLEYACSEATLGFLMESVLPLAQANLDLLPTSTTRYAALGASMGGLMALYTGLRLPQVFGRVLSQSGAFRIPDHKFIAAELVRLVPLLDLEIWMDVGRFDSLLACNRQMRRLLLKKGYAFTYREFSAGHNYTAWRDDIPRGLETLFKIG